MPMNVRSLDEIIERKPTEEELQLIEVMLKLPPAKQELWFTAFTTIWDYENECLRSGFKQTSKPQNKVNDPLIALNNGLI